ncbi:MAG TPA: LuxR C-terminal-related transcriptional regulator, partial [Kineosporiaceae bacterium]|nr:LuxR C-terminal-related transcriptional regulator [Kineosporiaceae bacterium]
LDLLRTVAATLPPPVAGRPDPRPRRRPARPGHDVAPVTVPGSPPDAAAAELTPWPALGRTRRTLTAASGAGADDWAAAWQEWDRTRDSGTGTADAGTLRGLAGWGSRRELFAALHGQAPDGPVTAYLHGDWDRVAWAGREFLARTAPGWADLPEQVDPVEPDDLAGAALALLVALHRRDRNGSAALARRLAETGRRGRPPVVGYALAAAAWRQRPVPGATLRRLCQDLGQDLRRARREGPRNGLDLLLYAAYRLACALGHTDAPPRLARELDDLAGELRTARALLLAARAGAQLHRRPDRPDVTDQLRLALTLPDAPLGLGTLGRAQALVLLAEQSPAPRPEVTALAGEAAQLIAPLGARDWLARARNLQPAGNTPAPGTRSLATAEQIRSLIGEGLTNRQISARLNLSEKSVEGYVTRLLRTHRCANRAELAARRTDPSPRPRPEPRPA